MNNPRALRNAVVSIAALLLSPVLQADNIDLFDLLPTAGAISGVPGSTIGWGYTITNLSTTDWLVTTDLSAGSFQNGTPTSIFDFPILSPGESDTLQFNAVLSAGLYELTWNSTAPSGFTNDGNFVLSAEWWSGDPFNGGSFISDAMDETAAYSANVGTAIPEPSTGWPLGGAVALILAAGLRRRRSPGSLLQRALLHHRLLMRRARFAGC